MSDIQEFHNPDSLPGQPIGDECSDQIVPRRGIVISESGQTVPVCMPGPSEDLNDELPVGTGYDALMNPQNPGWDPMREISQTSPIGSKDQKPHQVVLRMNRQSGENSGLPHSETVTGNNNIVAALNIYCEMNGYHPRNILKIPTPELGYDWDTDNWDLYVEEGVKTAQYPIMLARLKKMFDTWAEMTGASVKPKIHFSVFPPQAGRPPSTMSGGDNILVDPKNPREQIVIVTASGGKIRTVKEYLREQSILAHEINHVYSLIFAICKADGKPRLPSILSQPNHLFTLLDEGQSSMMEALVYWLYDIAPSEIPKHWDVLLERPEIIYTACATNYSFGLMVSANQLERRKYSQHFVGLLERIANGGYIDFFDPEFLDRINFRRSARGNDSGTIQQSFITQPPEVLLTYPIGTLVYYILTREDKRRGGNGFTWYGRVMRGIQDQPLYKTKERNFWAEVAKEFPELHREKVNAEISQLLFQCHQKTAELSGDPDPVTHLRRYIDAYKIYYGKEKGRTIDPALIRSARDWHDGIFQGLVTMIVETIIAENLYNKASSERVLSRVKHRMQPKPKRGPVTFQGGERIVLGGEPVNDSNPLPLALPRQSFSLEGQGEYENPELIYQILHDCGYPDFKSKDPD